jgi:hypothetical protein
MLKLKKKKVRPNTQTHTHDMHHCHTQVNQMSHTYDCYKPINHCLYEK